MEANVKMFLKQTSISQNIFQYDSETNDYMILRGNQRGFMIKDLLKEYKDETKEMLEELYYDENTNQHTKYIIKEIIKTNKLKR